MNTKCCNLEKNRKKEFEAREKEQERQFELRKLEHERVHVDNAREDRGKGDDSTEIVGYVKLLEKSFPQTMCNPMEALEFFDHLHRLMKIFSIPERLHVKLILIFLDTTIVKSLDSEINRSVKTMKWSMKLFWLNSILLLIFTLNGLDPQESHVHK